MTTFSFPSVVEVGSVIPQEKFVSIFLFVSVQFRLTSTLQFIDHKLKYQLNIFSTLCRSLNQLDLLSLCKIDNFFRITARIQSTHIAFVGSQDNYYWIGGVISNESEPLLYVFKGFLPTDLESKNSAISILQIGRYQTTILFLSSSVPQLQLI